MHFSFQIINLFMNFATVGSMSFDKVESSASRTFICNWKSTILFLRQEVGVKNGEEEEVLTDDSYIHACYGLRYTFLR